STACMKKMLYSLLPKSQVKARILKQLAAAISAALTISATSSLKPSPALAAGDIPPYKIRPS
ncbi:MAG: hypothetical protein ACRC62_36740, partial [Microcoleus sp.]